MISVGVTLVYMASVSRPRGKMADDSGIVNVQVLVTMVVDVKDVSLIYSHKQYRPVNAPWSKRPVCHRRISLFGTV